MRVPKTDNLYKDMVKGLKEFPEITSITDFSNVNMYLSKNNSILIVFVDAREFYPTSLDDDLIYFMQDIITQYNIGAYLIRIARCKSITNLEETQDLKTYLEGHPYLVFSWREAFIASIKGLPQYKDLINMPDYMFLKYCYTFIKDRALMEEICDDYKE